MRALPESFRADAEAASGAIHVDPTSWDGPAYERPPPEHLDAIQDAVIAGEQVVLGYVARDRSTTTRTVHPLGLATKGTVWYLVAGTDAGQRTFRVDRMTSVEPTGEPVERPDGFDLAETWRMVTDEVEQRRTPVRADARCRPDVVWLCRTVLGTRIRIGAAEDDGRVRIEIRGHSLQSLAGEIAGFGARLEVIDPPELRDRARPHRRRAPRRLCRQADSGQRFRTGRS